MLNWKRQCEAVHYEKPSWNSIDFRGYIAWSDDSKKLAVGNLNYGVDVYELEDRKLKLVSQLECRDPNGLIKQIDFAQGGNIVVAGGDRGALYVWQLPEGIELRALSHGTGA